MDKLDCNECIHQSVCNQLGKSILKLSEAVGYEKTEKDEGKQDSAYSRVALTKNYSEYLKCPEYLNL